MATSENNASWSESDFIVFIDSIARSDWNTTLKFIKQYPDIINAEGKDSSGNVLTALHKAVLCSPYSVCKLLVEHGANPNSCTSGGDYPLLYACRRGNLPLTYLLLYHGAKTDVRDGQGRSAVHFVSMSGQVVSFAFFESEDALFRIDLEACDKRGKNALHYIAEFGHIELFQYIRRRVKLFEALAYARDSNGDTPLHLAITRGHTTFLHDTLETLARNELQRDANAAATARQDQRTVADLLAANNSAGFTCYDISRQLASSSKSTAASPYPRANANGGHGAAAKFSAMFEYLKRGTMGRNRSLIVKFFAQDRERAYRAALLSPFIRTFGVFFIWLISAYSPSPTLKAIATTFNVLVLLHFARDIVRADHRLTHISRAPNPIFFSLYSACLLHTLIGLYFWTLPAAFTVEAAAASAPNPPNDDPIGGESGSATRTSPTAFVLLTIATVLFFAAYTHLLRVDPGYVTTNATNQKTGKRLTFIDCAVDGLSIERFCAVCELFTDGVDVRHCRLCQRCVRGQDHHCVFLTRCVSRDMVKFFVLWLILDCAIQFTLIYAAFSYVKTQYHESFLRFAPGEDTIAILTWFADVHWFIALILLTIVTSLWAAMLVFYQIRTLLYQRSGHGHGHGHSHGQTHSQGISRCVGIVSRLCHRH